VNLSAAVQASLLLVSNLLALVSLNLIHLPETLETALVLLLAVAVFQPSITNVT